MTSARRFEGVYPILVTPFDERERFDPESLGRIVRFMAEIGADGVTVLGVLGESDRVTDGEREAVIRTAVEAAQGRIPVVVGASHRGTLATAAWSRTAESLGAAAVMVTPAAERVPSEERIFESFLRVSKETSLPIVVQDHPASTGVHLSVPLLLRLVEEIPAVACIKEEAPPTPVKIAALLRGMSGRRVPVLTGLGALYGIFDLERGAAGFMTGFAFPEALIAMVRAARKNRPDEAWAVYSRFLPLIVFEQQPGIAVRKEIFRLRGLVATATVRHPGSGLSPGVAEQVRALIDRVLPGADITRPIRAGR